MTYFLEYVTGRSVGRVGLDSGTSHDALAKAEQVLKGLSCMRAVLRHASAPNPSFGDGMVLAGFTAGEGWSINERLAR